MTHCNVDVKNSSLAPLFAGLTYTLKPTKTGFDLTAKGYNEKMPKFLLTIVDAIYALDLSEGWTIVLYFYCINLRDRDVHDYMQFENELSLWRSIKVKVR